MEIKKLGKALSSKRRINIMKLISKKPKTAIDTFREYEDVFRDVKHRETIYRDLELLVELELVNKYYDENSKELKYELNFNNISIEVVDGKIKLKKE